MVVLVLDHPGGHAAKFLLFQVPIFVVVFQGQFFGANDFCPYIGDAEAAFFKGEAVSILVQEDGVYKYTAYSFFFLVFVQHQGAIDDKQAYALIDLWSCKSYPVRMIHGGI